jgi:hypothetical protein
MSILDIMFSLGHHYEALRSLLPGQLRLEKTTGSPPPTTSTSLSAYLASQFCLTMEGHISS